jgi:ADP-heptose:LPS heptosyltransferase
MGWGDDLITTSLVKRAYEKHKKPICVGDGREIKWSEVFNNNPKISKDIYPGCIWVNSYKGCRPYITGVTNDKLTWNKKYKVEPGEIFFTPDELRWTDEDFIYIEPNVKAGWNKNKDWGFDKWKQVVKGLPNLNFIQGYGEKLVEQRDTRSFRDACALLSRAKLFVGTDGGLHHAAAALGIPAVVVWGGFIGPDILGYDSHINLHSGVKSCGRKSKCQHCSDALNQITVEMVINAIHSITESRKTGTSEEVHRLSA